MGISRVYRLLKLITVLQRNRAYSVNELADELQVSRRTVFRDLNMLEMANIPYYFDQERGGYGVSEHFFLAPVNLTLPEALAVLTLTGRMRGTRQVPLLAHGRRAAMKLESVLPQPLLEHVGSIMERMDLVLSPVARHDQTEALFDELATALAEKSVCKIVYLSFHEQRQMSLTVWPLRLMFHSRGWYLLAWSPRHKQMRTFKLIRIRKLSVTDRHFDPPEQADVDAPFGQAWSMIPEGKVYDIHLHFDAAVAGNVAEVQWHSSQSVEWNDDGSIEFHARVDGLGEIGWWILGYGDRVEVVAPVSLREHIARTASRVAARHTTAGGGS